MDYNEFIKHCGTIYICYVRDSYKFISKQYQFGGTDTYAIAKVVVEGIGDCTFGISQIDKRCYFNQGVDEETYDYAPTRFIVLEIDPNDMSNTKLIEGQYKYGRRDVFIDVQNLTGRHEFLILADLDFPHKTPETSFSITCYSGGKAYFDDSCEISLYEYLLQFSMAHDQTAPADDPSMRREEAECGVQWNSLTNGYDYGYQYNLFYNMSGQDVISSGQIVCFTGTKVIGPEGTDDNQWSIRIPNDSLNGFFYRCDISGYKKKEKKA